MIEISTPGKKHTPAIDPYRIFFPLGIALGFAGILIWPLSYFGVLTGYWGMSHAFLQSDGFLFSFIAGFLLTALPRFSGTENPNLPSQIALAATILFGAVCLELQLYQAAQSAFVLGYIIFFFLVSKRFAKRTRQLPETFTLVGFGVLAGFLGSIANTLSAFGLVGGGWGLAGKRALTEGMALMLVLGIGGFLGPRLLGFEKLNLVNMGGLSSGKHRNFFNFRQVATASGAIILLSIFIEYVYGVEWMSVVRAIVATLVLSLSLEPWRKPVSQTTLAKCVWSAVWLIIIGLWLSACFPVYRIDMLHVLFIGGFTLMILAVGMRVTLSHGGHGLSSEKDNWPLRIGLVAGTIAMLSRVGAAFSPPSAYMAHLMLAGVLLLIALAIWGWRILSLMYRRNYQV